MQRQGFYLLGQFVAMVNSLRDITNGQAASEGKLRHLDLPAAPKRSTDNSTHNSVVSNLFRQNMVSQR
jgi:hypothetical protein